MKMRDFLIDLPDGTVKSAPATRFRVTDSGALVLYANTRNPAVDEAVLALAPGGWREIVENDGGPLP